MLRCRKASGPQSIPVPAPEYEHLPHPLTPDIYQICSKRSFDGQVCKLQLQNLNQPRNSLRGIP